MWFNRQTNKTYYLQSPHEPRAWGAKLPEQMRVWLCSPHCRILLWETRRQLQHWPKDPKPCKDGSALGGMSLGTPAALSKPLWAPSEPFFGVCAACSHAEDVLGAQAGAAGEGRRQSSASSCPSKGLVTAHLRRLLFFRATSQGKLIQVGKIITPRC